MWCFHDRLREFTFKDSAHIAMCPDCSSFDNKRVDVLGNCFLEIPKAKEELHFGLLLDKAGLSMDAGNMKELVYSGDITSVMGQMSSKQVRSPIEYSTLYDHEWVARQRPFPHTHEMPRRFTSYCVHCIEVVLSVKRPWVVRMTKGVYLPVDHECNSVRVYDLQGNLIEVKAQ